MKIIAITGTKGKTTVTRMVEYAARHVLDTDTLRVDSDGHYINGKQKSTREDSLNMIDKASTVCPGRYLIDLYRKNNKGIAVLECSFGSGGAVGLGFKNHNIGIFTNVFEDHINYKNINSKKDLFNYKSFIIKLVSRGGYLVANFDDSLISKNAPKLLPEDSKMLPFGKSFKNFNINEFLNKKSNRIITYNDKFIVLKDKNKEINLVDYTKIPCTYGGLYIPSIYNLMAVYGGLLVLVDFDLSYLENINYFVNKFTLNKYGARLVNIKTDERLVVIDYAHEKESLKEIAKLGHKLGNRVIGVLRIAPDRDNKLIMETGASLVNLYDKVIIYDKIDGIKRKTYKKRNLIRKKGEVSKIFYDGFLQGGKNKKDIERIILEENAIKRAYEISRPGDFIIVISGDDHKETYDNIKKYFVRKKSYNEFVKQQI